MPGRSRRGSSPLTRGKLEGVEVQHDGFRLIPAHAGKTTSWTCTTAASPAHPRSRGENVRLAPRGLVLGGSSPLTRGKLLTEGLPVSGQRLIPAHAGKTVRRRGRTRWGSAHPRSRGENMQAAMQLTRDNGSSPLTRGKPYLKDGLRYRVGLIPAHAGKTGPTEAAQ